jgi:ABC-type transport system involved in multi-copper enzyme maturation permease subunit
MIPTLARILVIARNTLTEAVRQKVLNVLLIFGLVLVGSSVGVSALATPGLDSSSLFSEQIKFVKDFGCGAIGLFGFFIALLSVAQLIPQELHNRTIYTILSKPVRRSEFLLGKFAGVVLLLALCVALMSLAFAAALYFQEWKDVSLTNGLYGVGSKNWNSNPTAISLYQHDIREIVSQSCDPRLIEAVLLIFAKLVMTAGIALFISTFATSSIFTIVTTFMIYLIGHMEGTAREVWLGHGAETSLWLSALVGLISTLIPDMNSFTIVDEILAGNVVPWAHAFDLIGYAGLYLVVLLALSVVIFDFREI